MWVSVQRCGKGVGFAQNEEASRVYQGGSSHEALNLGAEYADVNKTR